MSTSGSKKLSLINIHVKRVELPEGCSLVSQWKEHDYSSGPAEPPELLPARQKQEEKPTYTTRCEQKNHVEI